VSVDPTIQTLSKSVLVTHKWPVFGGEFDLLADRIPLLPAGPGVYAILITEGEPLRYPCGRSFVIYIGRATRDEGLRGRLKEHHQYARQCRAEPEGGSIYLPRYEWVNAAGGVAVFSEAPSGQSAARMESLLLHAFESMHYTLPVANGPHGVRDTDGEEHAIARTLPSLR
jgi:hypothetical protein